MKEKSIMNRTRLLISVVLLGVSLGIVSCNSNPAGVQAPGGTGKSDTGMAGTSAAAVGHAMEKVRSDLKELAYDYKKDPACGMPLKAGLEDTVHYKGKLYGFCSKECKDAFLKDPASYVAQIK